MEIFKFADDTKLLEKVNNTDDRDLLHLDMKQMMNWSDFWQLPFNASKCIWDGIITGTHQELDVVEEVKDLGVFLTAVIRPSRHCQEAYSKASKVLGMIARTKSLVRPHLEYCIPMWS